MEFKLLYLSTVLMFFPFAIFLHMQGLCEQTVKVLQLMEHEGMEPNLIMLNVLINAFGIAGRHLEALSVYHHIKESVIPFCVLNLNLMTHLKVKLFMLIVI